MLYKRGNVWWFKFQFNGAVIYRSTRQSNKKVAAKMEAEYKLRLQNGEIGINEEPIPEFASALQQFIEWTRMTSKPGTAKRHETSGVALLKVFAGRKLSAITVNDVLAYQSQRLNASHRVTGERLKPATTNRELAALRALFNYWIRQGCRLKNPVEKLKFTPEDPNVFYVLSPAEEALYLAACSQPLYDIALIILRTGMRPGEVYGLTKGQVNLSAGWLKIEKGKTPAARRTLYFGDEVRRILQARIETIDSEYLFPHDTNPRLPMTKANHGHYGALKRSGLKFRLYDLRHTAATRLARNNTDLVTLAAILGHSKIQMVLRYAHPVEAAKQEAMLKLGNLGLVTESGTVREIEN
jgi:integrase